MLLHFRFPSLMWLLILANSCTEPQSETFLKNIVPFVISLILEQASVPLGGSKAYAYYFFRLHAVTRTSKAMLK